MSVPRASRAAPSSVEEELVEARRSLADLEDRHRRLGDGAARAQAEEKSLICECTGLQKRLARTVALERSHANYAEEAEETAITLQQLCMSLSIDPTSSARPDLDTTSVEAGLGVRRAAVSWAESLRADVEERQARLGRVSAKVIDLRHEVASLRQRLVHETGLGKSLHMVRERLAHFRNLTALTSLPIVVPMVASDLEMLQVRIRELERHLDEKRRPAMSPRSNNAMEGAAQIDALTSQVDGLRDHCAEAKREISKLHGELHLRREALLAARRHNDGEAASTHEGPSSTHTPSEYSSSFRGSDIAAHPNQWHRASLMVSTVQKDKLWLTARSSTSATNDRQIAITETRLENNASLCGPSDAENATSGHARQKRVQDNINLNQSDTCNKTEAWKRCTNQSGEIIFETAHGVLEKIPQTNMNDEPLRETDMSDRHPEANISSSSSDCNFQ